MTGHDRPDSAELLPLPVVPLPASEEMAEVEGRWAAAILISAFATGGVLARATKQAGLRWWLLNVPVAMLVGAAGSVTGTAATYSARAAWRVLLGREPSRQLRFWARYGASFAASGLAFDLTASRLEGRAVWHGTGAWWWTIAWPLAALMLFVNATEVETGARLAAERRARASDRTSLRNHYALDADLARLADLRVPFTFVYVDLDGFKHVNDRLGHKAGDDVLVGIAAVLSRLDAVAYHLHGDELAFLVPGHDDSKVETLVRSVFTAIRRIGEQRGVDLGATFGAAHSGSTGDNPDAVRHAADEEMRRAKEAGKRRLAFGARAPIDLSA